MSLSTERRALNKDKSERVLSGDEVGTSVPGKLGSVSFLLAFSPGPHNTQEVVDYLFGTVQREVQRSRCLLRKPPTPLSLKINTTD